MFSREKIVKVMLKRKKKQIYRCFMLNCEAHHEYQKNKQEMNKLAIDFLKKSCYEAFK
jgi:hypothetical protein